jgi:hypothetical protein
MAFLRVITDVHLEWTGDAPRYRTWVNGELFGERTWLWPDDYAEELFQIEAPPGQYQIRVENLDPDRAQMNNCNLRVDFGPGRILDNDILEVYDESQ